MCEIFSFVFYTVGSIAVVVATAATKYWQKQQLKAVYGFVVGY